MSVSKINPDELRLARKAGFRKKAPKKPGRGASLTVLENYVSRHNNFVKEVKAAAAKARKLTSMQKQIFG